MAKLTVRGIEALRPKEASYKVTIDRGLYLRVAPDGVKTWLARYVVSGVQKQARLPRPYGSGGDDGYMSLAQATAENARIQALARDGIDFLEQKAEIERAHAEAKAAAEATNTPFVELYETWLANGVSRKNDNATLRRAFAKDVLPYVGDRPIREVDDIELLQLLRNIGRKRNCPRTAESRLADLRQMYRWAIKRQPWRSILVNGNPADLIELKQITAANYEPVIRSRTLSPLEIRSLRDVFENMQQDYENAADKRAADRPVQLETQLALWICLGTGCRIGELLQSRWEHVDLDKGTWFVPREHTKTHVDWLVYLSDFSKRQFQALFELTGKVAWCFPSKDKTGHVCLKTVGKQVGDRQSRFKKRKALKNRRNDNTLVLADGEHGAWTPHDLRRTASTLMQSLRVHPDVIDRCQNHVLPGSKVRRHYLHYDYAEEKREAWKLLGDRLDAILNSSNVIHLQWPAERSPIAEAGAPFSTSRVVNF